MALKLFDENKAKRMAKAASKRTGYACVVKSRGAFYVETYPAMIRSWELLIAEYTSSKHLED